VFIHVKDLAKSVEWYGKLLGKDIPIKRRYTYIQRLPTPDLDIARSFFDKNNVKYENVTKETIHFCDLDENVLMACSI